MHLSCSIFSPLVPGYVYFSGFALNFIYLVRLKNSLVYLEVEKHVSQDDK